MTCVSQVPVDRPMRDVHYSLGNYSLTKNGAVGMWQVPSAGELSFNFSLESEIEANMSGIDERDFVGFLQSLDPKWPLYIVFTCLWSNAFRF